MILTALGPIAAYRMHMPKWAAMPASGAGATLVSYTVQLSKVVDFRGGYQPVTWPELWEEFACDWRKLWFDRSIEPPSWVLAEEAIAAGAKGILFASAVEPGGTNLVIYTYQLDPQDQLEVHDPAGALPKNQDSWR